MTAINLGITEPQYLILCELAMKRTMYDALFTRRERVSLTAMHGKGLVYPFSGKWRITDKGYNANNRANQIIENR